jgi:DNA replication protein DnaC
MTPHDIHPSLKRLKSSGILATMEIREAETQRWGYLEFLQCLCLDEIERREPQTLARRMGAARFEQVQMLSPFDLAHRRGLRTPGVNSSAKGRPF